MKRFLLLAAFAFTTTVYGQVSIGIRIGAPPAPRIVRVRPVAPRSRIHLGRRLLVPGGSSLQMARRLLDAPPV